MNRASVFKAWWLAAFLCGCTPTGDGARLYATATKAPSLEAKAITELKHLGPTLADKGANFGVYSKNATRMELVLFDDPEATRPTKQFAMERFGEVWNLYVEGVGVGQHYGFVAWGPNWPYDPAWVPGTTTGFVADVDDRGNRFNPNKLLTDPYGKAFHRDHDWSKGSLGTGPARGVSTWAAAAKSVIVKSEYVWSASETKWRENRQKADNPGHNWNDLVFYETHPKGFTKDPVSGVAHPGTYRGFGEKAAYLKDLGITAVELMPVHEKPLDGGYWGYMNLSYFAPELSYAYKQGPRDVIDEFKGMVDALHEAGVELVVDVVYNHVGEGGLWRQRRELGGGSLDLDTDAKLVNVDPVETAGLYSYRGLDNASYYALAPDGKNYWNNTGVGHQTRANNLPVRKLIMDSLRWYVEELHVDGFRFDLAPVLGEKDGDFNNWDDVKNTALQEIIDDPVLQKYNTRVIAEPWSAGGNDPYKVGKFPSATSKPGTGWFEWNGRYRDWWRALLNDDAWKFSSLEGDADGGFTLTGFDRYFKWNGRRPYHSVNFVTVHDGFTLYDVFTYAQKQNGCGPLNPSCCDGERLSAWCDKESGENNNRSREWGSGDDNEAMKRQLMRTAFVAMMIAHGSPFILGGDEWMRTQLGNNNAYSSRADNESNWFQWGNWVQSKEATRMHDFVRQAIRLRREHTYALSPSDWDTAASFSWKNADNGTPPNWGSRHVMLHHHDKTKGPELAILINLERGDTRFKLPEGRAWTRLIDTQSYLDRDGYFASSGHDDKTSANAELDAPTPVPGGEYTAKGSTIVVLEAK